MGDMKDILVLQIKSQELDHKQHKLGCEADAAKHIALMRTLNDNASSSLNEMPTLPRLETTKEWPHFWTIMNHYLSKKKYSYGKIRRLEYIDAPGEYNNFKASLAITDALVPVLKGDTINKFLWRNDEYKGKGFKIFALLQDDFA